MTLSFSSYPLKFLVLRNTASKRNKQYWWRRYGLPTASRHLTAAVFLSQLQPTLIHGWVACRTRGEVNQQILSPISSKNKAQTSTDPQLSHIFCSLLFSYSTSSIPIIKLFVNLLATLWITQLYVDHIALHKQPVNSLRRSALSFWDSFIFSSQNRRASQLIVMKDSELHDSVTSDSSSLSFHCEE